MKKNTLLLMLLIFIGSYPATAQQRGFKNISIEIDGQQTTLYTGSYALLIGISDYSEGWPDLPGVKTDIEAVSSALQKNDFHVEIVEDATDKEIENAIDHFIEKYGIEANNRLIIYFAGHGQTMKMHDGRNLGYIVPANAPLPDINPGLFHRRAISMRKFDSWARDILSKHAMFLFDACFSGSLFNLSRAVPASVSYNTSRPVRQFITSGSAEEQVPDHSLFREYFVKAITTGDADANNDGYLTGTELGSYLFDKVTNYSYDQQHPQAGKIRDQYLDKGDFVFVLEPRPMQNDLPGGIVVETEEPSVRSGSIQISAAFSGSLFLDEAFLKKVNAGSRVTLDHVPVGKHTLKIEGDHTWIETVDVTEGTTAYASAVDAKPELDRYSWEPEMVFVKGGTFLMGCTKEQTACREDEKPAHEVSLDDFYIGKYELTQKIWKEVMGENPSRYASCEDCPVESVSWNDVQRFIKVLNRKSGKSYRLPTEAEWEYASRGGAMQKETKYAGSNNIDEVAWYKNNGEGKTHPVGQKQPNELNIYDMSGNVLEWCNDWYKKDYYNNSPLNNPEGPSSGASLVYRGGSWNDEPNRCRVARRNHNTSGVNRFHNLGFRLVIPAK